MTITRILLVALLSLPVTLSAQIQLGTIILKVSFKPGVAEELGIDRISASLLYKDGKLSITKNPSADRRGIFL